jgi:hypothetical protein
MRRNSILVAVILLCTTSCVSVLSRVSDEEAWNEYFKELKIQAESESRSIASNATGVKILRQILNGVPFRSYLISCDSRECFQSQLVIAFDQAFRRVKDQEINLSTEEYTREQKLFLEMYSHDKVLNWVETFHRILFSGVELRTAQRAVDLANACESSLDSKEEIQLTNFSPYLGGISYLSRTYYHCINQQWLPELDQLLKETTDRLGIVIKSEEAKRWILQRQVSPIYRKTLNDIFSQRKQEEMSAWLKEWKETETQIDWKMPLEELIRNEVPKLRTKYHFINLESLLTQKVQSKR